MRKYILYKFYFLALCILIGCQCIPSLDTEQEITPSQYSKVMCVNCAPQFEKLKIYAGDFLLHSALYYGMEEGFRYINVLPGVINFVVLYKSDSTLFNGMVSLRKAVPYTFFIYQLQKRIQPLLLYDTLSSYSFTNSYFRFVNIANNSPGSLVFTVEQQYPVAVGLGFRSFTKFFTTYPEKYNIEIRDAEKNSVLFFYKSYSFLPGKGYTIVLRGDFKVASGIGSPSVLIIQHNFDEIYYQEIK